MVHFAALTILVSSQGQAFLRVKSFNNQKERIVHNSLFHQKLAVIFNSGYEISLLIRIQTNQIRLDVLLDFHEVQIFHYRIAMLTFPPERGWHFDVPVHLTAFNVENHSLGFSLLKFYDVFH